MEMDFYIGVLLLPDNPCIIFNGVEGALLHMVASPWLGKSTVPRGRVNEPISARDIAVAMADIKWP